MRRIWKAAVVMVISGLAFAQNAAPAQPAADSAMPDASANMPSSSVAGPEYVIGPEDVLHIAVWKEPDLTASLPVRPDGKISLPLLNDVQAAGLTPIQLADVLTERLK